jgi:hypothetical protein
MIARAESLRGGGVVVEENELKISRMLFSSKEPKIYAKPHDHHWKYRRYIFLQQDATRYRVNI